MNPLKRKNQSKSIHSSRSSLIDLDGVDDHLVNVSDPEPQGMLEEELNPTLASSTEYSIAVDKSRDYRVYRLNTPPLESVQDISKQSEISLVSDHSSESAYENDTYRKKFDKLRKIRMAILESTRITDENLSDVPPPIGMFGEESSLSDISIKDRTKTSTLDNRKKLIEDGNRHKSDLPGPSTVIHTSGNSKMQHTDRKRTAYKENSRIDQNNQNSDMSMSSLLNMSQLSTSFLSIVDSFLDKSIVKRFQSHSDAIKQTSSPAKFTQSGLNMLEDISSISLISAAMDATDNRESQIVENVLPDQSKLLDNIEDVTLASSTDETGQLPYVTTDHYSKKFEELHTKRMAFKDISEIIEERMPGIEEISEISLVDLSRTVEMDVTDVNNNLVIVKNGEENDWKIDLKFTKIGSDHSRAETKETSEGNIRIRLEKNKGMRMVSKETQTEPVKILPIDTPSTSKQSFGKKLKSAIPITGKHKKSNFTTLNNK